MAYQPVPTVLVVPLRLSSSATHKASKQANEFKPNLKKKYPGSKLTSIPEQFRGTWYRSDPLSKSALKLIINKHTIGDSVVYRQVDKSIKLDHNSEQKNKTYSGGDSMIAIEQHQGQTWMRVREFLTTVDIIYITGQFKDILVYILHILPEISTTHFSKTKH